MTLLPYVVAAWLFLVGLYGIVRSSHLVHLVNCLGVAQSSTYVLLVAVGYRRGAGAPVFSDVPLTTPAVDPIVEGLTVTDIVVHAAVTALLLALAIQAQKRFKTLDPRRLRSMRG